MSSKLFFMKLTWAAFLLIAMPIAVPAQSESKHSASTANAQTPVEFNGTWSGTFFSKHSNVAPFTFTVVMSRDSRGHLVGNSSLSSNCLRGVQLQVTINGSNVVLAGSNEEGENLTVRGTVDKSGTLLKATYILNGSATGKCETDDGTLDLVKR